MSNRIEGDRERGSPLLSSHRANGPTTCAVRRYGARACSRLQRSRADPCGAAQALSIGGSFISYIYSAPPLKLKQSGWIGNYALGSSYIPLPW